jgi:hypothetical protein
MLGTGCWIKNIKTKKKGRMKVRHEDKGKRRMIKKNV